MSLYLGTGTRTAPRNQCAILAEIAFCNYYLGKTLLSQQSDGIEKAMCFGANLAQELRKKDHAAIIEMDTFSAQTEAKTISSILSKHDISEIVCWSPDKAHSIETTTKKSGHLRTILEIVDPNIEVLNTQSSYPLVQLRRLIKVQENLDSQALVSAYYNDIEIDGFEVIDQDWKDLALDKQNLCCLPRDCYSASPPGGSSRSLFSSHIDKFKELNPYSPLARERLGTYKSTDDKTLASLYTVTSYGLFSKNYCDYYSIRKALKSLAIENRGKTIIIPHNPAGLLHADRVTIRSILNELKMYVTFKFNIYDK